MEEQKGEDTIACNITHPASESRAVPSLNKAQTKDKQKKTVTSSLSRLIDTQSIGDIHFVLDKLNYTVEKHQHWKFIRTEYESNDRVKVARVLRGDTMLVGLLPDADEQAIRNAVANLGLWIEDDNVDLEILRLRFPEDRLDEFWELHSQLMKRDDLFRFIEPEHLYAVSSELPNDPQVRAPGSWGILAMNFPDTWNLATSTAVTVAVIDTGVDIDHPDLSGVIWINSSEIPDNGMDDDNNGYVDDVNGWNSAQSNGEVIDLHGHGTAVAGIIGAVHDNFSEIAGGAPFAKIMPVRNSVSNLSSTFDSANALTYAVKNGAQIVNMSFGNSNLSFTFDTAVSYARSNGVIMVASSGNDGKEANSNFPARFEEVISVGALDSDGNRPDYSNYGVDVDLMAPGHGVLTLLANGTTIGSPYNSFLTTLNGTSFAAPYISAAAAYLVQRNPNWDVDQVLSALRSSGSEPVIWNPETGIGFINVARAGFIMNPIKVSFVQPVSGHVFRNSIDLAVTAINSEQITAYYQPANDAQNWQLINFTLGTSLSYTWDTSGLPDDEYTVRFEISNTEQTINVFRSFRIAHAAPHYQRVSDVNGSRISTADLDNDGQLELLYAPFRGLAAFRPHEGYLSGWPLGDSPYEPGYSGNAFNNYGHNYGGPSCGDIDGDGQLEIAIFHAPQNNEWSKSVLTVSDNQGKIITNLVKQFDNGRTHYNSFMSPVLADLDADGNDEIIYVSRSEAGSGMIHALKGDGSELSGWPALLPANHIACYGTPAVGDFNGDGSSEVAIMTDKGLIVIYEANGQQLSGWPQQFDSATKQSHFLVFADFDHDAFLELLVASKSGQMSMFEHDASTCTGWPRSFSISNPPSVGNLDNDDELEIAFPSSNVQHVINHDGSALAGWPQSGSSSLGMAILVDVDGDGWVDVYNSEYSQRIVCWNRNGNMLKSLGFPITTRYYGTSESKVAGDFDDDGFLEISCRKYEQGFHLYELNTPDSQSSLEHSMFHLTPGRQNRYTSPELSAVMTQSYSERNAIDLSINGRGFLAGTTLRADATPLSITALTSDQIIFTLPADIPEGLFTLTLESQNNGKLTLPNRLFVFESYDGDSDSDLISNIWEAIYQLDPFDNGTQSPKNGPEGDKDSDGIFNLLEFALRGNNFSPSRRDYLVSLFDKSNMEFQFSFDESTGVQCWISSDLNKWEEVNDNLDPTNYLYQKTIDADGLSEIRIKALHKHRSFIRFSASLNE